MNIRHLLVAFLLVTLAACGGQPEPSAAPAPTDAAEAAVAAAATATETVSEPTAESSGKPVATSAQDWQFVEGKHFQRFTNAKGTSSSPDKIEVAEVFWYGCGHCFSFEPTIQKWTAGLGSDVSFVKIPVMWNPTTEVHGRLYYTIEALNLPKEAHGAVFSSIHVQRKMLASEGAQKAFLTSKYDISEDDFEKAFRSFSVNGKIQQAKTLTQRYQVKSVPLLIINGKYAVTGDEVRSFEDMIAIAEELIARERAGQ